MTKTIALAVALGLSGVAAAQSVEVLHRWTSGGEAAALDLLKASLEKQGVQWSDMPMTGGSTEAARTEVLARVGAGNPPTAMQLPDFDITDWARQGVLANLNAVATQEGWDKTVPKALQAFSKYDGQWIAAPVNVHSTNWVWANKVVLNRVGVTHMPATFDEFIAAIEKAQKAGYIGLAHGGQAWQDAILFDSVVLSTGGVAFYKKAFIEKDKTALGSPTLLKAFERMSQLRKLVDKDYANRDWKLATAMVISEKAVFQITGDWAKSEFINARKVPGIDFLCMRFPGTQGVVAFNSDPIVMFKLPGDRSDAQLKLASAVMDPAFQSAFNVVNGSAPARTDVPSTAFDACGKKAIVDLAEANTNNTLVDSMAQGHAVPASIRRVFYDVITRHFNGQIDSPTAVQEMVAAVE
jgi:glucose/mannose transport system substrate-binding protein